MKRKISLLISIAFFCAIFFNVISVLGQVTDDQDEGGGGGGGMDMKTMVMECTHTGGSGTVCLYIGNLNPCFTHGEVIPSNCY